MKNDKINKEKVLILTVGLPYSGKSTWAKEQGCPIVSPDSIRISLHGHRFIKEAEDMVWLIAKHMVKSLFIAGHNMVILDACNTTKLRREDWEYEWTLTRKNFYTSKAKCKVRAQLNNDAEILPIIDSMAAEIEYSDD